VVHTQDEVGEMAHNFNRLQEEIGRAAAGLEGARVGLSDARDALTASNTRLRFELAERKVFEHELQRLAFHDTLSGLPNRALFHDHLERALVQSRGDGSAVAVLFLDLANFKVVNDSLGHNAGDRLLVEVGRRLRTVIRAEDTVARLGGDEFTIMLARISGEIDAVKLAERIHGALRAPIVLDGHEAIIGSSIGIAISRVGSDDADGLLRDADLAMYRAKANGKGRHTVFDPSMIVQAMERLELEADLRHGLDHGEFHVAFQPIIDLVTGRVSELEALVRWEHPQRGPVMPNQFIALAEETGLIIPLGQWVLEDACRQAHVWRQQFPTEPPLTMSVNLSARQFQHPTLVADITRALTEGGLTPDALKLEITESIVMRDAEGAITIMQQLRALGIRLAIDDFGTGYSSLGYLKRFPVDTLKIDRSFVDGLGRDQNDTAIVRSVVALAKSLSLATTAEGIETREQLEELKALGCDRGQGYYVARPLSAGAVGTLLTQDSLGRQPDLGPTTPGVSVRI
jgi:diguanylate cyclase (GGDEF)-like protein